MKPVMILENSSNALVLENNQEKKGYFLRGTFTEFDVLNRNERVYTADKFLPALNEMNERITQFGGVYGHLDHPSNFDICLEKSSHIIKKASFISERNLVHGEIQLLSTDYGRNARSIIDDGLPLFVSSRAAGITEGNGHVTLKKLFTYDLVADPGFANAKMEMHSLNESLGYNNNANFRIFEMSDESKIEELFNMNGNDMITKNQFEDYSKYLVSEINKTKNLLSESIKNGELSPLKIEEMSNYYEELRKNSEQMSKYLEYLGNKVSIVVNENKSLKKTTEELVKHNDYLAETLEKVGNYSKYVAEKLDDNITETKTVNEKVDNTVKFAEYLAENVNKAITYSDYIAETLDKNINYGEYLAEKLNRNINFSDYLAENLDTAINYNEYIAEKLENNIAYSAYIAENLDDNIAYGEYVAEKLDMSVSYQSMIVEKLNGNKQLLENSSEFEFPSFETPVEFGMEEVEDEFEVPFGQEETEEDDEQEFGGDQEHEDIMKELDEIENQLDSIEDKVEDISTEENEEENEIEEIENEIEEVEETEEETEEEISGQIENEIENEIEEDENFGEAVNYEKSELSLSIDKLIAEAKKRDASEKTDLNFLKFLNKSQVESFYELNQDEQENVILHISERGNYFTAKDVLSLISEALSTKNETLEERITRLMPENTKEIWEGLDNKSKKTIYSQARLYPEELLMTETQIENFWSTRNFKKETTKKLISHDEIIQEEKLNNDEMNQILERFNKL